MEKSCGLVSVDCKSQIKETTGLKSVFVKDLV